MTKTYITENQLFATIHLSLFTFNLTLVTIYLKRKNSNFLYSTTPVPAVRGNSRNNAKAFRAA